MALNGFKRKTLKGKGTKLLTFARIITTVNFAFFCDILLSYSYYVKRRFGRTRKLYF